MLLINRQLDYAIFDSCNFSYIDTRRLRRRTMKKKKRRCFRRLTREWDELPAAVLMVSTIAVERAITLELKMRALMELLKVGLRGGTATGGGERQGIGRS